MTDMVVDPTNQSGLGENSEIISAVLSGETFAGLEQYRKERSLNRSEAIRELLARSFWADTIVDESCDFRVKAISGTVDGDTVGDLEVDDS